MRHVAHALLVGVEAKQAGDRPLLVGDDQPVSGAVSNPVLCTLSPDRPLLVGDDEPVSGAVTSFEQGSNAFKLLKLVQTFKSTEKRAKPPEVAEFVFERHETCTA